MERFVSRAWVVRAIGLAVGLSVISGGTLLARQDPPPQPAPKPPEQADMLKFTQNTPHLIVWAVKSNKAADFEALWAAIQAQFAKSERPEVKEFASTFTNMYKVNAGAPSTPEAPVVYVFQIDKPSTTVSYNPGKIVYDFLYFQKDGKEGGIPRTEADAIFSKAGNMQEMFASIVAWPLVKIGS
jgi:hypothetical protein